MSELLVSRWAGRMPKRAPYVVCFLTQNILGSETTTKQLRRHAT